MRKAKVEIKVEPYPKGGWYVVERVNGKEWWRSSNYQSIELAEVRMTERKELKANIAKSLDNKLAKRLKPRNGLATKPTLVKRISKAKMRYLKRFDEYNEMRNQQPESERQTEFQLTEIHRLFGVHATTIERAIYYRQIKPRGKKLIRGHWVRTFKYEDLCSYFDILRGITNGNDAATMGNG
jgi:hypothetical protein|nr:MAG TPA: hypothetical protein [Caudoviricetes sp.]